MDKYVRGNQQLWNELTPIHERSAFYDVEGFKKSRCTLKSIELEEVGDVTGKSLLHLQCHFGMDTLSWARLGAKVTGVDFSDESITLARSLSKELGIEADFICCDIYDLPRNLEGEFDIVFTSYGILAWLPDLKKWAEVIAHFLKPGGTFYLVEEHPIIKVFDESADVRELKVSYTYFHTPEPERYELKGSYAAADAIVTHPAFEWTHSLGDVLNALIGASLKIEYVHEFPICCYRALSFMEQDEAGWWRIKGDKIPLTFSLKATKT